MATRGRSSPARGGNNRRDGRPGGQRGFQPQRDSQDRPRPARARDNDAPGESRLSARAGRASDTRSRRGATGAQQPATSLRAERASPSQRPQRAERASPSQRPPRAERASPSQRPPRAERASLSQRPQRAERASPSQRPPRAERASPSQRPPRAERASLSQRPQRAERASPSQRPPRTERASPSHGEPERLQKVLARMGVASRREAEEWIRAGRLTVNGEPAVLGTRVGRTDHLRLDGRLIHRHEVAAGQVYLCHRSPGENLRTPDEPSEHQALMDRLPRRAGNRFIAVSPMPRSDGGLEIVTSDGSLAVQLQRTVHSLPSEFSVRVLGELEEPSLRAILAGALDRGVNLQVESCELGGGEGANKWYTIITRGGSGKDVRQLFERHGALVSRVLRTKLGTLELDRLLSRGQFRPLTEAEIQSLIASPAEAEAPPE